MASIHNFDSNQEIFWLVGENVRFCAVTLNVLTAGTGLCVIVSCGAWLLPVSAAGTGVLLVPLPADLKALA